MLQGRSLQKVNQKTTPNHLMPLSLLLVLLCWDLQITCPLAGSAAEGQDARPHTPGRSAWPPSFCPWPPPARGHCCFAFATDGSSCIPPTWCWSAVHLQPNRHTQAEVSHLTRLLWETVWKPWTCELCFHFLMTEEDISGLQASFGRKVSYGFEWVPAL